MKIKLPLPLMAAIAALPPLAIDLYLPAIPSIAENLDTQISIVQNSLSIYLMGFGLGLLIFGPFSDRFGRRPMAMFGLLGFALSSYLISISTSVDQFLFLRLIQGFLGSAATVVIPAMIRDCYGKDTAKGLSNVMMIMLLAPLVAPLMGSYLLSIGGWELLFEFLCAYGAILFLLTIIFLPETKPNDSNSVPRSFFGNYKIIFSNKSIYLDLFCFMLTSITFFTYLTSASFIYITYFEVSETQFGLLFACTASSLIFANFINSRVVSRVGARKMVQSGLILGVLSTAALITVSYLGLNVYWTLACFILIIGCLGISTINADSLVLMEFPNQASSASAVTGTLRFGFGALAGPILVIIYNGTPIPIAIMMFICLLGAGLAQLLKSSQIRKEQT